ncbi:MAG: RagB/SusD family nutrient uptake outer membrane protein [Bacteroidales bacterium]|nr:RagB/SusD family nutrient uptake outer membrane protein [Bacteroidales bacterium]
MKRILIILSLLLPLAACDFLNPQPEDAYTVSVSYKTQDDFEKAVAGVYDSQQKLYAGAECWFRAMILRGDEVRAGTGGSSSTGISNFLDDAKVPVLAAGWQYLWQMISRANMILCRIDEGDFKLEERRDFIKGEAYALRAWAYYTLCWQFGGMPLITSELSLKEVRTIPRSEASETFDLAEGDYKRAIALLPDRWEDADDTGRITKYAAMGGLARLYMFRSEFAKARFYLKQIIDSGLYDMEEQYVDCFLDSHDNGKERVWEVQFSGGLSGEGNTFISGLLPEGYNKEGDVNALMPFNGYSTAMRIALDLMACYEPGDIRKSVSTVQNLVIAGVKEPVYSYIIKYVHYSYRPQARDDWANNLPILRYTDVLMLYAECLNEDGYSAGGEAFRILNRVRARAGLPPYTSAELTNQASFRTALQEERRIEFAFEGLRWQDLLRWGIAQDAMTDHFSLADNGNGTYRMNDYQVLFPIPYDELSRYNDDTVMKQNPGY